MASTEWKTVLTLPEPSTSLVGGGAKLAVRPGRAVSLVFPFEGDSVDSVDEFVLVFRGVEAFKCSYFRACDAWAVHAYDRLVDLGESGWLASVRGNLARNSAPQDGLMHLGVYLDDGPFYEFICRSFSNDPDP